MGEFDSLSKFVNSCILVIKRYYFFKVRFEKYQQHNLYLLVVCL